MTRTERRARQSDPCIEGGDTHAWESLGLDDVDGTLANVRRCVWCRKEQSKPYGAGGRRAWATRRRPTSQAPGRTGPGHGEEQICATQ